MTPARALKRLAYAAVRRSGTLAALRWLHRDRLPILCYHSIADGMRGNLHLPIQRFREQLDFLSRNYRVVSLEHAIALLGDGLPERAVALTFDDGYANNLAVAAPLLAEYDFPATVFLATDYMGRSRFWWDDPRAQRGGADAARVLRAATLEERARLLGQWGAEPVREDALRPATWDECRGAPPNITFGGHGAAHRLLSEIAPAEAEEELQHCQRALRTELPARAAPLFCYPAGQWTEAVRSALPHHGFRAAVTAGDTREAQRLAQAGDDPFLLPRIGVNSSMSLAAFAANIAGVHHLFR